MRPCIVVHGGAGREAPGDEGPRERGCIDAARAGWAILDGGGSALDAVVAAVATLEDDPWFNAGTGACATSEGTIEMDASVMEGAELRAGAIGAVERIKNPIRLARAVLDDGRHVMLVGPQALRFAKSRGIVECDPASLMVDRNGLARDDGADAPGTVGAVAADVHGHVAAATSTGGVGGKLPGRVGDSAIIGAGTYADDRLGAASATGLGEAIMRVTLARLTLDLLAKGSPPTLAATEALGVLRARVGAHCGIIVVDPSGCAGYAHTTDTMPIAYMHRGLDTPATR
jgi:beta-aspartyl-peptidase (threonine type)